MDSAKKDTLTENMESQPQTRTSHIPYGQTWEIEAGEAYFDRMLCAYNRKYRHRTGKGYFIFCLLFDAFVVAATIKGFMDGANMLEVVGGFGGVFVIYILFPALTVFFGVMVFAPNRVSFVGRKRAIRAFAEDVAAKGDGVLQGRFDYLGVVLSAGSDKVCIPYALCYDKAEIDGETFILVGDKKEQSVLHNLVGFNASMRENVGLAFAVPPTCADEILEAGKVQIEKMHEDETYKNRVLNFLGE